jgi:hypothetical protein
MLVRSTLAMPFYRELPEAAAAHLAARIEEAHAPRRAN